MGAGGGGGKSQRIVILGCNPPQAANYCRNSRLVVYEDDLKCVANEILSKQFNGILCSETPRF